MNLDPDVTRYTLDPLNDLAQASEIRENVIMPQYALYNHGRWAIVGRAEIDNVASWKVLE